ncbi:MAG: hypothetical protein ABI120_24160 [Gemmatimonadaceae bacterium]
MINAGLVPVSNRRGQVTDAHGKHANINTNRFGRALLLNLRPGRTVIDGGDDGDTVRDLETGRHLVPISIAEPH